MYDCILKILKENQNKTIAIVSHATDISYLLNKWCNIKIEDNMLSYKYNNKVFPAYLFVLFQPLQQERNRNQNKAVNRSIIRIRSSLLHKDWQSGNNTQQQLMRLRVLQGNIDTDRIKN